MPELPEGMTPRHVHVIDAIYQLERTGEMVKVSDVSEYLEVTRPSITRLIRELETLGAVSKIADTQDKRIVWLGVDGSGAQILRQNIFGGILAGSAASWKIWSRRNC